MIQANIAELKSRLSYYLRLVKGGERVVICERNQPVAEIMPLTKPIDKQLRESAFGLFAGAIDLKELKEAMRPMTDEEAQAFIEGRY